MVKIIAGKINTGKTTNLINEYRKNLIGDGFAAVKKMKGKEVYGYTMLRLSDSNTIPWMIHQNHYHQDFTHSGKFGPFYLNLSLLPLLESVINELIEKQVTPIYLDEVGVLEIMGGGYHNILKKVLVSGLDLVIAVREDLVKPVTTHFAISDYELIKVPGEE
jgi:nucleoside-triphosphatase THEP1